MITPAGTIAAHASVAAPSVHTCGQSTAAVLQPPVSASDTKVYYRDGNTKIKFLTPDGQTGNVTTVPGSATKISFFSVSPDDTRIAVLVEAGVLSDDHLHVKTLRDAWSEALRAAQQSK